MKKINLEIIVLVLACIFSIGMFVKRLPILDWMTLSAGASVVIFFVLLFKKI